MKVYFYPHAYLRDRQLDTIRNWPRSEVVNAHIAENREGNQVSAKQANAAKIQLAWPQILPLVNLKRRPKGAPADAVVYVWGALVASGDFIVDLDNPWALVGYNLRAMPFYKPFIRRTLLSARCREIRCMSQACRESLRTLFGEAVYRKASVHYPCMPPAVTEADITNAPQCRFLFVGTQFEIKGGVALFKAFSRLHGQGLDVRLDAITHLPEEYAQLARDCPGIHVHPARFTRDEIHHRFMRDADVLLLPTYVESFGMVALEALAHGLALIATDVYALREMVVDRRNGNLLPPPISVWDGVLPSRHYYDLKNLKKHIRATDTKTFEERLFAAMLAFARDPGWRLDARKESLRLLDRKFQPRRPAD